MAQSIRDALVANAVPEFLFTRSAIGSLVNDETGRDFARDCGYVVGNPSIWVYRALFDRNGYSTRIVSVHADESWATAPAIQETPDPDPTPFETAWATVQAKFGVWSFCRRADIASGIGNFGLLFLGLDDGLPLDAPVNTEKPRNLTFLRVLDQTLVWVKDRVLDPLDPRFGQPDTYSITFADPRLETPIGGTSPQITPTTVHWTRVIHLADNRLSSEIFGVPRLEPVLDYLYDVRKVLGGSAEMFWKGAFPGLAFETLPGDMNIEIDAESIKAEVNAYHRGLKRYLAIENMKVTSLSPQIADPAAHVTQQLIAICATIGVPLRIFLGSESGHLASTQDAGAWKGRLMARQTNYLTPLVIRPLIDRLILFGVLPTPKLGPDGYSVMWNDLNALSDIEKTDNALKVTQSLQQYETGMVGNVMGLRDYYVTVMGKTAAEADVLVAGAVAYRPTMKLLNPVPPAPAGPTQSGGNQSGNPKAKKTGRPKGKLEGS